jgi:hypothetical protein
MEGPSGENLYTETCKDKKKLFIHVNNGSLPNLALRCK